MDCEGCEHESIPYSRRVGEVKEILVEYHGGYEDVERKLRDEGFKNIKYSKITNFLCKSPDELFSNSPDPLQGYIYATKQVKLSGER